MLFQPLIFKNYTHLIRFIKNELSEESLAKLPQSLQKGKSDEIISKLFIVDTKGNTYFIPHLLNAEQNSSNKEIFFKTTGEQTISLTTLSEKINSDFNLSNLPFNRGLANELIRLKDVNSKKEKIATLTANITANINRCPIIKSNIFVPAITLYGTNGSYDTFSTWNHPLDPVISKPLSPNHIYLDQSILSLRRIGFEELNKSINKKNSRTLENLLDIVSKQLGTYQAGSITACASSAKDKAAKENEQNALKTMKEIKQQRRKINELQAEISNTIAKIAYLRKENKKIQQERRNTNVKLGVAILFTIICFGTCFTLAPSIIVLLLLPILFAKIISSTSAISGLIGLGFSASHSTTKKEEKWQIKTNNEEIRIEERKRIELEKQVFALRKNLNDYSFLLRKEKYTQESNQINTFSILVKTIITNIKARLANLEPSLTQPPAVPPQPDNPPTPIATITPLH